MTARLTPVFNYLDQCKGKRRYRRRRDALRAKRQFETGLRGVHVIAYPCPHCATWHLGKPRDGAEPQRGYVARW